MLLGFKTELKPNNVQRTLLAKHCGVARHAWNIGLSAVKGVLEHNRQNPENKLKLPSSIDLHKWLVASIKPDFTWYYEVSKCSPQQALRNLSTALSDFFKGKKIRGKRVGFPSYKKKGKHDSFYLEGSLECNHNAIKLPRIGWVRTYERLPHGFKPKNVVVTRQASGWFCTWKIETEPQQTIKTIETVGVDLGVNALATLSTGEVFLGAKSYKNNEKKLARLQWLNRHKQKGSKNYKKAQCQIARLHKRIADIRLDTLHKLTTYLAKNHGTVVIEDLCVSGMLANHKLASSISDMSFYELRRQLEYKCSLSGSNLVVVDRFYPSSKTCSNCGFLKEKLTLSERIFNCSECGLTIDRDLNASRNLCQFVAVSSTVSACRTGRRRRSQSESGS